MHLSLFSLVDSDMGFLSIGKLQFVVFVQAALVGLVGAAQAGIVGDPAR